jgi:dienelactone hydrolase
MRWTIGFLLVFSLFLSSTRLSAGSIDRVLADGQQPADTRLGKLVDLDGYFPLNPPNTKAEWETRSERLRRGTLMATGLWPLPEHTTPPKATVHGLIDQGDYTIEKVYFETYPGFYLTGNLYRPKNAKAKMPGVLCPHGHWTDGRFYLHTMRGGEKTLDRLINEGQERFRPAGQSPLQSRCVQLARMGCVVFHYDMVGKADSKQLEHRSGVRPKMNTIKNWGYFSPQAELHLQSINGLQTFNSIRALDWLSSLPEVDAKRIGVTGCSGGGTQTFLLCAIDPRPAVAFPAVMVSTSMQGGCPCENGCYLRTQEGNIGLAALFAPRPMGMTGANDWTKEIETKGLPELKAVYKLFGAADKVMAKAFPQFPHNYNYVSRSVMYHWLNRHLKLGQQEPIVEEDYPLLTKKELTVWDEKHPQPAGGDQFERQLVRDITAINEKQIEALLPSDKSKLAEFQKVIGGAVDIMIGRTAGESSEVEAINVKQVQVGPYSLQKGILRQESKKESVPFALLLPAGQKKLGTAGRIAVWVSEKGKSSLFNAQGKPIAPVTRLLDAGQAVIGIDFLGTGEFSPDGKPAEKARLTPQKYKAAWGAYAGYTFGYNYSLFSKRTHDILAAIAYVHKKAPKSEIDLIALEGAGRWAAAAGAQSGGMIDRLAIDTAGFRFKSINAFDHPDFLPGGAKYFDLPGMIALNANSKIWLSGEFDLPEVIQAAFEAAETADNLTVDQGIADKAVSRTIDWLSK